MLAAQILNIFRYAAAARRRRRRHRLRSPSRHRHVVDCHADRQRRARRDDGDMRATSDERQIKRVRGALAIREEARRAPKDKRAQIF